MGLQLDPQRTRFATFVMLLVALLVAVFFAAPLVWSVLQIFIIAFLIALALDGPVRWQVRRGVPRWAAALNLLLLLLVALVAIASFLIPPLIAQAREFLNGLPVLWANTTRQLAVLLHRFPGARDALDINRFMATVFTGAGSWITTARSIFATAFGALAGSILIFITVLYSLLDPWPLLYGVRGLFPKGWWSTIDRLASHIAVRLRAWVTGIFILSVLVGLLDYLALWLINLFYEPGVPFILFFAILGAILEFIPFVGPILVTAIAGLVALSVSPMTALLVIIAFTLIQQIEGNLLSPLVFHSTMKLHPVSLLFALVVLTGLFGIFGALIAAPVTAVIKVLYDEWYYPLGHEDEHPALPPNDAADCTTPSDI